MPNETLIPPGPTPSCRVDYGSWTFKVPDSISVERLREFHADVCYHVMPNGEFKSPKTGRHFEQVWDHDSGCSLEMTDPSSKKRNAGLALLNIPGSVFASFDPKERISLYSDVYSLEGFYRCTRLDTQFTVLDPPIEIGQLCDSVEAGDLWAKNFSTQRTHGDRARDGSWRKPPTCYFGASDSPTIGRIYSHGAKHGWEIPDIRFEVQQRKRNADDTFRALVNRTKEELTEGPLLLVNEASLVMSVSGEKLDLRDTSSIDRSEVGGKWLRKAPRAAWYQELISEAAAPVERRSRPVPTLDQTVRAGIEQYGPSDAAWMMRLMVMEGASIEEASMALTWRRIAQMKDAHRQRAMAGMTKAQATKLQKLYARLTREAAQCTEIIGCE